MVDGFRSLIKDRIADAYFGGMGKVMMRKTHERLNWICQHVKGDIVWDIGCSQGITSILLAREGYSVYAIDADSQAIGDARDLLEQEPEHVSSRVVFEQADCLSYIPPQKVDTVIMGEILEHFNQPEKVVDAAASALKSEGTLIITTPFGINDFFDHKHTFYIHKPLSYLKQGFQVVGIEVLGKWVGFVAKKRNSDELDGECDLGVLEILENSFYKIERELVEKLEAEHKQQTELSAQLAEKGQQISELKRKEEVYRASIERLEKELRNARDRYSDLETKVSSSRWLFAQTADQVVHAPRDISRRLRRSFRKRFVPPVDAAPVAGTKGKTWAPTLADPSYRKALSSNVILHFAPILPRRFVKRMRRRMEKNTASALRTSTDGCKARIKNGVSIYPTQLRNARPQNIQKNTIPLSLRQPQWAEKLSKPTKQLRIACILDDFSHICFSREAEFLQLGATNTLNELENFQPDLLFVESAWQGRDGTWDRKIGQRSQELHDSIEWCRNRDIPTVFWNKEDPVHFATFLNTAALFDFVFTTDIDCIARYKSELGHDNVFLLPFGCQPEIHNPIEEYQRKDAICFAGAYYARYPERMRDFEEFMEKLPPKIPLEIYDRNFGKDHPDYAFPERFDQYIMGTLPANQIGIAYKGYRYALNMNSIKRSQTMFARRVVELLASNTIVISNYSRALRILFGDLIVATDSGSEALKQLEQLSKKPDREERFRLAGLRKVMKEHTYQSRLEYIVSCVTNTDRRSPLPRFCVFSRVETCDEASRVISTFERQRGVEAKLTVVAPSSLEANNLPKCSKQVKIVSLDDVSHQSLSDFAGDDVEWIAAMVPDDHYGPNYLLDIALATRYARDKEVIGKTEYYTYEGGKAIRNSFAAAYKSTGKLAARRSAISKDAADRINAREWISKLEGWQYELPEQFAIDPFNYCQGGNVATHRREVSDVVDDIDLDTGVTLESLLRKAENISVGARETAEIESLDGGELAELFGTGRAQDIHTTTTEDGWTITSDLSDGKHTYIYAPTPVNTTWLRSKCKKRNRLKCHLDADAGLDISFVMEYFDAENNRIDHSILPANRNHTVKLPIEAATAKLGLRILGPGEARINELHFDHIDFSGAPIATARHLIVTNHYPSYDDIYRNGFVHRRVVSYKNAGVNVDVFRLRVKERLSFHEFHGVDVITGGKEDLQRLIENGHYESIIVHFLDPDMWSVLRQFCRNTRIVVWVHGFEIQPWWRRSFNYETKKHLKRAKSASEDRINFWKDIFSNYQDDLHFTFVSRHFANEVMEDYDLPLPASRYSVIHNPIDTELFRYEPKEASQRLRILAIGPYMSRKYANDLSVEAILALRDKPFFSDLEFRIIGDGKLFEETLAPLRGLDNVTIERRFLTQPEIAELHKEYGVFLCPTRWDSQGVSRDEAMSSGLVPVTNAVAAVPEFVDESCGFMAPPEDAAGLAAAIETLYHDPERFLAMSEAAAARVRRQSAAEEVIKKELELFASNSTSTASN